MKIAFVPKFFRMLNKLPKELQEEALERIELFKDKSNHRVLKVHKLHGRFKNDYGFSVDYKNRVVFAYLSESEVVLLAIGDHDIYH